MMINIARMNIHSENMRSRRDAGWVGEKQTRRRWKEELEE